MKAGVRTLPRAVRNLPARAGREPGGDSGMKRKRESDDEGMTKLHVRGGKSQEFDGGRALVMDLEILPNLMAMRVSRP
jgi:hypothetical protein